MFGYKVPLTFPGSKLNFNPYLLGRCIATNNNKIPNFLSGDITEIKIPNNFKFNNKTSRGHLHSKVRFSKVRSFHVVSCVHYSTTCKQELKRESATTSNANIVTRHKLPNVPTGGLRRIRNIIQLKVWEVLCMPLTRTHHYDSS